MSLASSTSRSFSDALDCARRGEEVPVVAILRTMLLEGRLVKQRGMRHGGAQNGSLTSISRIWARTECATRASPRFKEVDT